MELVRRITLSARKPEDVQPNASSYKHATLAASREQQDEQSDSMVQAIVSAHIGTAVATDADLLRSPRHQRYRDLSCHGMAQVIIFYPRLSPRQPRATLKTQNKRRAFRPAVY
jgi:hypothetical protein